VDRILCPEKASRSFLTLTRTEKTQDDCQGVGEFYIAPKMRTIAPLVHMWLIDGQLRYVS
jgi:hypothetical protein